MKIDKSVLAKAVGIMLLGWLALPIIYYILLKRKNEKTETVPSEGREDNISQG